jgi:cbb3-type cytochrome oxidase subunit 1
VWSYWLLVAGVTMMVVDLTMAGLVEAQTWQSGAPWIESVRAARFYWVIRAHSAVPIAGGFIALLIGITTGPRRQLTTDRDDAIDLRGADRLMPRAASATVEPA